MDKLHTVKKNQDFYNIIHNGYFAKDNIFTIYNKVNDLPSYRFGISVSKKIGNSVERNYCKRQVRTIIDKYKKNYQNGNDYIIIIKKDFIGVDFSKKEESFIKLIKKINNHYKGAVNEKK